MTTKTINLYLIDEVNIKIDGLSEHEIDHVIKHTERSVPGAFQSAAFKLKKWNGKESPVRPDGFTFEYMMDKVLHILEKDFLYDLDHDLTIHDMRAPADFMYDVDFIEKDYLSHMGITLHEHQVNAVNKVIQEQKGIIDVATSGGKSYVCLCLSKVYDPYIGSVIIVPTQELLEQTYKDYVSDGTLSVSKITPSMSKEKKQQAIKDHNHVIITWRLLKNNKDLFAGFNGMVIQDECHVIGDVMLNALKDTFSEAPVRIGMTATVPKTLYKREKIFCHIGGEVLAKVQTKELQEQNIVAGCDILMVPTVDSTIVHEGGFDDWDDEKAYLNKNKFRANAISDYIQSLPATNTLILSHPQLGEKIAKRLDIGFVDKDTKTDKRMEHYAEFAHADDKMLMATFGTAGTGISINRIFRLILIDVGKNYTATIQGIGRGIRLDGEVNYVDIIDIYSETKYSLRHKQQRASLYKREGHSFMESTTPILIQR